MVLVHAVSMKSNFVVIHCNILREKARTEMARQVHIGFHHMQFRVSKRRWDMFCFKTNSVMYYLATLNGISFCTINESSGYGFRRSCCVSVVQGSFAGTFGYFREIGGFWVICDERRLWMSRLGPAIHTYAHHVFFLCDLFITKAFPQVTLYWQFLEVPRGCRGELQMVFKYFSRELGEPNSSLSVVI